jgi:hypothetical protein
MAEAEAVIFSTADDLGDQLEKATTAGIEML